MKFIVGTDADKFSVAICEQLGIDPGLVRRIVIDLRVREAARIYFETFADDEVLDVVLDSGITLVEEPA